tara:strand:- start:238 stop:630 length:393 start_codon:yes stop_codon:yes gene_type:complete
MFLLSQATLPPKKIEKVYRDILMIDSRKIMTSMVMSEPDFTLFRPLFKMTTVKSTQKSNRDKYCSIFGVIYRHLLTKNFMVVAWLTTILINAVYRMLYGSCVPFSRQKFNSKVSTWFSFNFLIPGELNEA